MENKKLIESLQIISKDPSGQKNYIKGLFKDVDYENAEEILLNYEDVKYLKDEYLYKPNLEKAFFELEQILDEIDEGRLFFFSTLNNSIWNKARNKAREILNILNSDE
ncbi:hypothetical protein MP478_15950 [Chryseobacterium sp. WG14]|uniref:hypothetical protein n=1 Tax=Chryseobacterium sp. WG14 TaxID=2926909 RepID=UPI00211E34F8|nr:hypothetical protein [Chryseobacterium sp. WG14]MCQ9640880.1 hypothetical protein [Chryseobacterium sp. WG14]